MKTVGSIYLPNETYKKATKIGIMCVCRSACVALHARIYFNCTYYTPPPLPSRRLYLSCDACLEVKTKDKQNCSMLCCVRQLCTIIRTQMWAVLTVLWIGFYHAWFISLCIHLFVFICVWSVFLFSTAYYVIVL